MLLQSRSQDLLKKTSFGFFLLILSACFSRNSLYVGEEEVGEARREELLAAKERLEQAREQRGRGIGESSVSIQELPKEALRRRNQSNMREEGSPEMDNNTDLAPLKETDEVPRIQELNTLVEERRDEVEILWAIPDSPVDAYILRFGFDKENLSEELRISSSELEIVEVEEYGKANRFVLRHIPPGQQVFVSLASERAGKVSPFSDLLVLEGKKD